MSVGILFIDVFHYNITDRYSYLKSSPALRKAPELYFPILRFRSNAVEAVWCKMLRDLVFFNPNFKIIVLHNITCDNLKISLKWP